MTQIIALLIPCLNEAKTIQSVIEGFRSHIPDIQVYVCDNGSTDETAFVAAANGATILTEPLKGKGNALRKLLKEVKADFYIMADGDATHNPIICQQMIEKLTQGSADVVHGVRLMEKKKSSTIRIIGNRFLALCTNLCLASRFTDVLTGYRAFTKKYAENFPCQSSGFEIEAEMNAYTIREKYRLCEIAASYADRENNAESKLRIVRDGLRIMFAILYFSAVYHPLYKSLKRL